jgi:serine/threonine protein kinase
MSSTPPAAPANASSALIDDHDALPAGTRFGELEILSVLGIGGFGIVYLAQDHALERQVALKEYMPSLLAGRGKGQMVSLRSGAHTETYALGLRSFVNEARLLARFNHPSLVKVYRFWEENGTAYMVMPYLQGRTLREVRRSISATPSEAWIRSVLDPLLDALELLHREDVFHRDIAPDNVLLPPGEPPVLLDFGAARRAIGDRTQTFTAILKPSYAPIEQYAEVVQLRQGPWTDIYALGAVVYYLLRGAPPPPATARAVQDDMVLLPPEENPGVSRQLLAAIEWALAVRPGDRPQHIAALRDVIEGRAAVPPPPQRTVIMAPPVPTRDAHDAEPITMEPTQPMTTPPSRIVRPVTAPSAAHARAETTVMPASPTVDTPAPRAFRRLPLVAAAAGAVVTLLAAFVWVVGGRSPAPAETTATLVRPAAASSVATLPAAARGPASAPAADAGTAAMAALGPASGVPRGRLRERLLRGADGASGPRARDAGAGAANLADTAASPRDACGSRVFLALAVCMEEQCERPRFKSHPQCDRVREIMERRRRGENG